MAGTVLTAIGRPEGAELISAGTGMLVGMGLADRRHRRNGGNGPPAGIVVAMLATLAAGCNGQKVTPRTVCDRARDAACGACAGLTSACPPSAEADSPPDVPVVEPPMPAGTDASGRIEEPGPS